MQHNNSPIKLFIHSIGHEGEGVGYYEGYTLFVDGALPGETVVVEIVEYHKNYAKAKLIQIEQHSPHRINPPCPIFDQCGGCQLMHLSYDQQLKAKHQRVVDALTRIAKIPDVYVEPCLPSPLPLAYRNKIQLPVRDNGDGIIFGLYKRGSHQLVEVDSCLIHGELGEKIFHKISSLIKATALTAFDPVSGKGDLRHLLIKSSARTQQVLVILVVNSAKKEQWTALAGQICEACPEVKGVVLNQNESSQNRILGQNFEILAGDGKIDEYIAGLHFKVSAASFFQVNPEQAEILYLKALEWADLKGNESVIDAFCGVGTLSLVFARHVKKIIGIECVGDAIKDAKENAKLNAIENAEFICAQAENWIKKLDYCDVVLLNPPRKGCEVSLLQRLSILKPKIIIYISCDPATLARDLAILIPMGYQLERVQPFDMFPQTAHVETLAKLKLLD